MNQSFETILSHPVMESLGWVLLNFLWQGAVVAVVLFLVLALLRRVSANARYLISCFALLMTATLPAITWTLLPEPLTRSNKETLKPVELAAVDLPGWPVGDAEPAGVMQQSFGPETPSSADLALTPPAVSLNENPPQNAVSVLEQMKHWFRSWIPFLTCAWLAGVLTLSIRLLFTWIQVQRLQQRGVQSPREEHQALLRQLAARLKISRTVRLLESIVVEVPTVIGWLKPVILLPVASVNSLTVQQLEAILAHELAHIRRADYVVNLVQSLIETLLFYHPAVWWMSARIRQEREHCCDDLATSISGDAASYVAALVRMEELRCEPRSVAVAARGGDLLTRAKRLLVPSAPDRLAPRWLTGVFAMAVAITIIGLPVLKTSLAEPSVARGTNSITGEKTPMGNDVDEKFEAKDKRTILGTVLHQGQPVANARVGLQASSNLRRYGNNELFVTTAITGNDGQYVLTVPNTVDSNSSVAIWAVAEGYQPTRENIVMTVSEASDSLQNITLAKSPGCVLRISDANGEPIPNAAVIVPSQTLTKSIDFEIPKDWRDLVSGKTDADGIVSLPYVVPEAVTRCQIQVPRQDSEIVITGFYFLNAKPAAKAPHHHFKLPKSGSLEGKIEVTDGQLPQDLKVILSTESSVTGEFHAPETGGVATAKVDSDGRFHVDSIAAGKLSIEPFLPVDQPLRAELPRNLRVVAGEKASFSVDVVKGVLLRGRIVASDTGTGLAGIQFIILYGSSADEPQDMLNNIPVSTDKQGFYQASVPPGRVILRIGWRDQHYSQVEYWSSRSSGLGSAFEVPDVDEFELEPITFVPSKMMDGQLVDQDGQPLVNWSVFGYPEIPGKPTESVTNCFGGITSDGEGKFSSLYPSTFPPVLWKVSHRDWPTPYESNDRKWIAKVISQEPLILQVDTNPAPPAPLRNAANSGDMADDDSIAASGLAGKWSLKSMQWNGIKVPEEQCRQTTMTIEGHQLTIDRYWNISFTNIDPVTRVAEGGFTADTGLAGAIHLNSPQMPYDIDLTINGVGTADQEEELAADERAAIRSGKLKVYGLCTVNGDELQLCLSDPRMPAPLARPTEFTAGESSERTLFVFKRIQP